jgi:hypothetical protein
MKIPLSHITQIALDDKVAEFFSLVNVCDENQRKYLMGAIFVAEVTV